MDKKFSWTSSFSVGNETLDTHHRKLFELISMFESEIEYAPDKEKCLALLEDLKSYTQMHFKEEEKYMKGLGFPMLNPHKIAHQKLIEALEDFENKKDFNKVTASAFLRKWITQHILEEDMEYFSYSKKIR